MSANPAKGSLHVREFQLNQEPPKRRKRAMALQRSRPIKFTDSNHPLLKNVKGDST